MRIIFAADHAGFELKEALKAYVQSELSFEIEDVGAATLDPADDFPIYIARAAEMVARDPQNTRAIVLGGSGQGEAMCANRLAGVRAVVYYGGSLDIIRLSREHNAANVLSLGARFVELEQAKEAVALWLQTPPANDPKYARRNALLDQS
jgi:ribose 5-phosphate isomerase B